MAARRLVTHRIISNHFIISHIAHRIYHHTLRRNHNLLKHDALQYALSIMCDLRHGSPDKASKKWQHQRETERHNQKHPVENQPVTVDE